MEDVYNAVVPVTIAVGRSKLLYLLYVIGKKMLWNVGRWGS